MVVESESVTVVRCGSAETQLRGRTRGIKRKARRPHGLGDAGHEAARLAQIALDAIDPDLAADLGLRVHTALRVHRQAGDQERRDGAHHDREHREHGHELDERHAAGVRQPAPHVEPAPPPSHGSTNVLIMMHPGPVGTSALFTTHPFGLARCPDVYTVWPLSSQCVAAETR